MNDTTWFWQIIDAHGLADVSSDEVAALKELVAKAARATTAESERDELLREKDRLEAALEPFAKAAEHDIGSTETDADIFQQMGQYNRAPKITVGDMRRARSALAPLGEE